MPLFLLAGGEIVLMLLGLRMARWLWRGWRSVWPAGGAPEPPEDDPPPGLPLEVLQGGRAARPARSAPAALPEGAPALRKAA